MYACKKCDKKFKTPQALGGHGNAHKRGRKKRKRRRRGIKCQYAGVTLDSTWELKYVQHLDDKGVQWRRVGEKFPYAYRGRMRYYIPDFYLPETREYIEIKGYETAMDRAKWRDFPRDLSHRVLKREELENLGVL